MQIHVEGQIYTRTEDNTINEFNAWLDLDRK